MGVRAVVVSVIVSFAVEAVFTCWTIPNSVVGMKLFAEVTPMRERKGSGRTASL